MLEIPLSFKPYQTKLREPVCQVPWEQVPDLVATWRCVLRNGWAYVHKREMGSLVLSHFKARLSKALGLTARKWTSQIAGEESSRLTPVIESLSLRSPPFPATSCFLRFIEPGFQGFNLK